jgi:hypothetical protein
MRSDVLSIHLVTYCYGIEIEIEVEIAHREPANSTGSHPAGLYTRPYMTYE